MCLENKGIFNANIDITIKVIEKPPQSRFLPDSSFPNERMKKAIDDVARAAFKFSAINAWADMLRKNRAVIRKNLLKPKIGF